MTEPRPSSTLCCLRPTEPDGFEVLMVQRSPGARFMASTWVFPGGAVDDIDRLGDNAGLLTGAADGDDVPWMLAALRELVEEVGIWLTPQPFGEPERRQGAAVYERLRREGLVFDGAALGYFANWITPTLVPVRFDARFYAAVVPGGVDPHPDGREIAAATWITPSEALVTSSMVVPLPTQEILRHLASFSSAEDLVAHARRLDSVEPIQPKLHVDPEGDLEILMPGDAGFDEVDETRAPDEGALRSAVRRAEGRGVKLPEMPR
jgi:8-oxo-dGTP pyrophosphatase MutT (NUDIX family)